LDLGFLTLKIEGGNVFPGTTSNSGRKIWAISPRSGELHIMADKVYKGNEGNRIKCTVVNLFPRFIPHWM